MLYSGSWDVDNRLYLIDVIMWTKTPLTIPQASIGTEFAHRPHKILAFSRDSISLIYIQQGERVGPVGASLEQDNRRLDREFHPRPTHIFTPAPLS